MIIETNCETEGKSDQQKTDTALAVQFTEIFLKKPDNITVLLGLLEVSNCKTDSCLKLKMVTLIKAVSYTVFDMINAVYS